MEATSIVRIVRKADYDIKMRDLYVWIDDGERANVKFGGELEILVTPGEHTIHASNRVYKRQIAFQAGGVPAVFEVANTARGCSGALFALGFGPYACELRRL